MNCGLCLMGTLVAVLITFLMHTFKYWQRRGVKTLRNNSLLGSWLQMKSLHHTTIMQELYERFKGQDKLAGFYVYTNPVAVILDLELVKTVLIKDFNRFTDRMIYKNDKDILSLNLFVVEGAKWRPLRNKLTSAFTAVKIKYMFPTVKAVACRLKQAFDVDLAHSDILNITDLSSRYTTDDIATCIFGMECNSLEDPLNEYRRILSKLGGNTEFNVKWYLFMQTYINVVGFMGFKIHPQYVEDFFMHVLMGNVKAREKSDIRRNDLMDLLLDLRKTPDAEGQPGITYNEIVAVLFAFFGAGYETSWTVISYALYELARHPEIQEKVRGQIVAKLKEHSSEFSYEASMEMPYLDQIISETVRLYPTLSYLERHPAEDYPIPGTDIVLAKGSAVYIPVRSIHYDPEIYEQPDEFRPERFHPAEVAKRHAQSFLGYGDGPRNCIGLRFGRIQVLVALVTLLTKYRFSVCEKTVDRFAFSDHTFTLRPLNDIYLRVDKLEEI